MKKYLFLLFGLVISLIPTFFVQQSITAHILSIIVNVLILLFILSIKNIKLRYFLVLVFVLSFFANILSILYYGDGMSQSGYGSILETNYKESFGFLSTFGYVKLIVALFFSFILAVILFRIESLVFSKTNKVTVFCLILLLPLMFIYMSAIKSGNFKRSVYEFSENKLALLSLVNKSIYISGDIYRYLYYKNEISVLHGPSSIDIPKYLLKSVNDNKIETIYIIVGESSAKKHYSLYGYDINTNPNLGKINEKGDLHIVDNVISPAPTTRESLKRILSFATSKKDDFIKYANLVDFLKTQGMTTKWISGQAETGIYDSLIGRVANSADNVQFHTDKSDLELLDYIDFNEKLKKQAVFIHIKGSHLPYKNYSKTQLLTMEKDKSKYKEYDATILNTDELLYSLIKKMDSKSLLLYFSDHGEVVGEGHGLNYFSKEQYEIPFIVYGHGSNEITKQINKYRDSNGIFNAEYLPNVLSTALFGYKDLTNSNEIKLGTIFTPYGNTEKYSIN